MVSKKHITKKCRVCIESYKSTLKETKLIKNKRLRDNLIDVWKTLWLNNSGDFDIISSILDCGKGSSSKKV